MWQCKRPGTRWSAHKALQKSFIENANPSVELTKQSNFAIVAVGNAFLGFTDRESRTHLSILTVRGVLMGHDEFGANQFKYLHAVGQTGRKVFVCSRSQ
jgi:hypothetical protein